MPSYSLASFKVQLRQCPLSTETDLQIGLFIAQAVNGLVLVDEAVEKQFDGVEHLVIGHAADNNVIICIVFAAAASQDKVQPSFGICIEAQYVQ